MNYRHAFHAGNFADVLKHLVLVLCLRHLAAKPQPVFLLDAFAGTGLYDLQSDAALRSPEWRDGIARVRAAAVAGGPVPEAVLAYLAALDGAGGGDQFYPGSPLLMASALRPGDRAVACDLHPEDGRTLADTVAGRGRIRVETRDGWAAVKALVPPPERRGLVLVDPPFELAGEFGRLAESVQTMVRKFATGTGLFWHADKDPAATGRYLDEIAVTGARLLCVSARVSGPGPGLRAHGLVILNPPHTLEAALTEALAWLTPVLARDPGAGHAVTRLSGQW